MVCQRLVDNFDAYLSEGPRPAGPRAWCTATTGWTTCSSAGPAPLRDLTVVDWQTVTWGPALTDVAYFIGCALRTEDRRAN